MRSSSFPLRSLFAVTLGLLAASVAPAATFELSSASVADIDRAFDSGALTSEQLVTLCLKRIEAYDKAGPHLNAIITLNPKALDTARALDAERKAHGPRSPIHGIPIILKDNYNTADLPTTAGSVFLEGSIPPADATMVARLRAAGAIILAKANLSEFALSAKTNGFSSLGGQTLNPHDLARGPAGSSGGSGASVAAWYVPIAFGTDTGGSIRNPSSANGIAGLKPTRGLLSRAGIVPLALSYDTGGPMARNVADLAAVLGTMTGIDSLDKETEPSLGRSYRDYTIFLHADALKGARLGVLTDYAGVDAGTKQVFIDAQARLKSLGATLVDIKLPEFIVNREAINAGIMNADFKANIAVYLSTLKPGYPKNLSDMVALADKFQPSPGHFANLSRWDIMRTGLSAMSVTDPVYLSINRNGQALIRDTLNALLLKYNLDAFIYPTVQEPAQRLDIDYSKPRAKTATSIANITGFPDLIVPAGVTDQRLPVTLSFLGSSYTEPRLLALGYAFEQATHARINPPTTPALPGERFDY